MEASDVKVGERYVLQIPSLRKNAPLYGLADWINTFTGGHLMKDVEGKDPVGIPGVGTTVMVRNDGYTVDTSTKSRKSSEPGVRIRLAREVLVHGRVKLGWADVDGLGLDPERTYWISGLVEVLDDEFGDYVHGGHVEEQEFTIPVSWLGSIEEATQRLEAWQAERQVRIAEIQAAVAAGQPIPVRRATKQPATKQRVPKRKP